MSRPRHLLLLALLAAAAWFQAVDALKCGSCVVGGLNGGLRGRGMCRRPWGKLQAPPEACSAHGL